MDHAAWIREIAFWVEQGKMEPQVAKIEIDARKWIAPRFHPMQFSEKFMTMERPKR